MLDSQVALVQDNQTVPNLRTMHGPFAPGVPAEGIRRVSCFSAWFHSKKPTVSRKGFGGNRQGSKSPGNGLIDTLESSRKSQQANNTMGVCTFKPMDNFCLGLEFSQKSIRLGILMDYGSFLAFNKDSLIDPESDFSPVPQSNEDPGLGTAVSRPWSLKKNGPWTPWTLGRKWDDPPSKAKKE